MIYSEKTAYLSLIGRLSVSQTPRDMMYDEVLSMSMPLTTGHRGMPADLQQKERGMEICELFVLASVVHFVYSYSRCMIPLNKMLREETIQ